MHYKNYPRDQIADLFFQQVKANNRMVICDKIQKPSDIGKTKLIYDEYGTIIGIVG